MSRAFPNEHHAVIPPVVDEAPRPLWSVLIPCYNCAQYLELTLQSVLGQDPGKDEMEIIVIDDCSERDDPAAVVERLGQGRVRFIRQEHNVGKVQNYESGLQLSRGHLIHQLHGDDLVLPDFYTAMEMAFKAHPEAGAFFCETEYINEFGIVTGKTGKEMEHTGIIDGFLLKIAVNQRIQTPSMVVRRQVYEQLGGFDRRLDCSEDWEMWIRVATSYPVGFCFEARSRYRSSFLNNSSQSIINGTRGVVQRKMFEIVDSYLPAAVARDVRKDRAKGQAEFFAQHIPYVLRYQGWVPALRLVREVFRFHSDFGVFRRVVAILWDGNRGAHPG